MVLCRELVLAARRGDKAFVAAWLESGGGVNVPIDRNERSLLLFVTYGRRPTADKMPGEFDEEHVALARYILERGADVNLSDVNGDTPLHFAARGSSELSPVMTALLLKAGANALVTNIKRHSPLTAVTRQLRTKGPSRPRMESTLILLRALPSLDCAWTNPATGSTYPIERLLDLQESRADPPLPSDNCFEALRAVVAGVRAAGGWRAYDRRPRAEVLRLRSLALRRRAVLPSATRHDGQYIRGLDFLVRCPPEIAWQILGYWRCRYPVETDMIDQLGYR